MQRRSFLSAILAAGVAPAILSQGSTMRLWVPRLDILSVDLSVSMAQYAELFRRTDLTPTLHEYVGDGAMIVNHKGGGFTVVRRMIPHHSGGFTFVDEPLASFTA